MTIFSLGLFFLQLLMLLVNWKSLPPQLPLFYSRPWGEDQLVVPFFLFLLPIFSILVFLLNSFILKLVKPLPPFLARTLQLTALLISGINCFNLWQIIRLVH